MDVEIIDLGLTNYQQTLEYQRQLHNKLIEKRKKGARNEKIYLLFTEHHPVITLGKHAKKENILYTKEILNEKGVAIYEIERGGDVTYHGPGQLVVYPILDLEELKLGVKKYVNLLEESVIKLVAEYGVRASRNEGAPGVWIKQHGTENKICALGIKCSHFCTMHGLALNVNTDLNGFRLINPCGFTDRGVTSLKKETEKTIDMQYVKKRFSEIFLSLILPL